MHEAADLTAALRPPGDPARPAAVAWPLPPEQVLGPGQNFHSTPA